MISCACGAAGQDAPGWEAQGLVEVCEDGKLRLHNRPPERCFEVEDTDDTSPLRYQLNWTTGRWDVFQRGRQIGTEIP